MEGRPTLPWGVLSVGCSLGLLGHVVRVVEFIERPLWSFQCLLKSLGCLVTPGTG